jgi:hypothetical protein
MPEPLDKHAVDLLSAALRHVRDAEHLATPNHSGYSPDQAHHLAGFGPECAQKATLQAIVREARDLVDRITAALWADGRLPDTFLGRGGR